MKEKQINVLMVEDDMGDVELTKEALEDSKVAIHLHVAENGVKAMEYLHQKGEYENVIQPDLILLDLNMPKKNGREVLKEIREDPKLKSIPVVVLTTSQHEQDIFASYNLGCNCYVTKPVDLEQFCKVVQSIESFWFTIVKLPGTSK